MKQNYKILKKGLLIFNKKLDYKILKKMENHNISTKDSYLSTNMIVEEIGIRLIHLTNTPTLIL